MSIVSVTRKLTFTAGHRLFRSDWTDARNREVFGPCSNPSGHGHNYELYVTVTGQVDPETGFVMDLAKLRDLVEEELLKDLDHANLNVDVAWLKGINPSTENLVVAMWSRLAPALEKGSMRLRRLRLAETDNNVAEYEGD